MGWKFQKVLKVRPNFCSTTKTINISTKFQQLINNGLNCITERLRWATTAYRKYCESYSYAHGYQSVVRFTNF